MRKSIFSLLYKKGHRDDLKNYRPISLTTIDYRILASILADRMQSVIGDLVNQDQTAYIKGRYMGYNIRLVEDVIEHFDKMKKKGLILALDFTKAFDSIEWYFMLKTLDFFRFGSSFKKWVNILYNSPEACIKNNGYISDTFAVKRGIRQGCQVSALIFILCVEIMALSIRQCIDLKGFDLGFSHKPTKIIQYADDTILFLKNEAELLKAFDVIGDFNKVSGLSLIFSKCEGLWIGSDKSKQNNCKKFGIKWPEHLCVLGIYVGHNKVKINDKNWGTKVQNIDSTLQSWKKRNLSLFGKIQIIKTFGMSKLILPATLAKTPGDVIKKVETLFYTFLWGSKDKVKRSTVIHEIKYGGLNMLDIKTFITSLKASWVLKIINSNPEIHTWSQLARDFIKSSYNLRYNFDENDSFPKLNSIPPFYKEVMQCYNKVFVTDETTFIQTINEQSIWGNRFITNRKNNKKNFYF